MPLLTDNVLTRVYSNKNHSSKNFSNKFRNNPNPRFVLESENFSNKNFLELPAGKLISDDLKNLLNQTSENVAIILRKLGFFVALAMWLSF